MQLEEGEIESDNDGIDPYTPLERPNFGPGSDLPQRTEEVDLNKRYSSSENSDDECMPKRAKLRRVNNSYKRNKYLVWCKDPNEHLTDFLDSIAMRNPDNDRNVENYIVPHADRKRKIAKRRYSDDHEDLKPLEIDALETSELNSFEEVAQDIATKLSEPNYDLVLRIVIIIGKEKAIEFYNKTKEIEKDGGMLIANRSRRRTSGGVFILLVRTDKDISKSQKNEIFEETKLQNQTKKSYTKKKQRKKKLSDWIVKMNDDKELESGQEEMNNPPPSPEPQLPDALPDLPLRRDIVSYSDLNLTPPSSVEHIEMQNIQDDVMKPLSPQPQGSPGTLSQQPNPPKKETEDDDEAYSMELIYD